MIITLDKSRELVNKYLQDNNNRLHSHESEVVLAYLAKKLGEDEELWATAGLLHDLDWEQTADNPDKHGLQTLGILKEEGFYLSAEVEHAISAHNEMYTGVRRESKLDYALAAGESITGLIYAYALMRPAKLDGMKASSLNKKFKDKKFAANVSREFIDDISNVGMERSAFFSVAIEAMQSISSEIF